MGFFSGDSLTGVASEVAASLENGNSVSDVLKTLMAKEQESLVADSVFIWLKKNWWLLLVIPVGMYFVFRIVKNIFSKK